MLAVSENEIREKKEKVFSTYFDFVEGEVVEDDKKISDLIESYTKIDETNDILIEKKFVFDQVNQLLTSKESNNDGYSG